MQVVEASAGDRAAAVETLAQRLVERFGAPDLAAARPAAEEEIAFAASLCDHAPGTLIAMHRVIEDGAVRETFRSLKPREGAKAAARLRIPRGGRRGGERRTRSIWWGSPSRQAAMTDFWLSCGHHLTDRDAGGGLVVTDEFLKAYLARPELTPPPEACAVERTIHAALLADPRRPVAEDEIAAIADPDARENWTLMIAFRDRLLRHRTLEAAYLALARDGVGRTPPLFLNQLVHLILRNALDDCDDPFVLRAAELFFRPQLVTLHEGSLLAADEETIAGAGAKPISPLVSMLGLPTGAHIDVMGDDNAASYFARSDLYDLALDLTAGREGHAALARVIEQWVRHLLAVNVTVEPLTEFARRASPGMSGSMPKARASAICCGTAKTSTRRRKAAWSPCSA